MPSQPKKMLIVAVLETLRKYTDEHHRLMQAPLLALLEKVSALTPICQEPPLAGSDAEKLMLLEQAAAQGKTVSFRASGTQYSGMTVLRIEREGKAALRSAKEKAGEPLPEENWLVTVQDRDSHETSVFPLCSLSDITVGS